MRVLREGKDAADGVDTVWATQKVLVQAATRIGGDLMQPVVARSPQDTLSHWFEQLRTTILARSAETESLARAGREGPLSVRGETARFQGANRELIARQSGDRRAGAGAHVRAADSRRDARRGPPCAA